MYLLYDEKESSIDGEVLHTLCFFFFSSLFLIEFPGMTTFFLSTAKQNIAYIVGHELAHQWFGNLVTMEWWTDLWLNEGFATWVGWMVVDKLFPEWNIWTQFLINEQHHGLKVTHTPP